MGEEQTLRQRANHNVAQQPLCITYPAMQNFELKSGLIHLLPLFRGVENEDPHKFLKEFHVVCIGMKPHNITEDQIKLRAFPFALQDGAKEWLYDLPPGSVTTWNDLARLFLGKYFPESRASSLRREIIGIKQAKREAFHTYWERFKKLCSRCPQHGISDHQLLQYFIEGLSPFERRLLNASSGGSITDKTPTQIRELISIMVEESKHNYQDDEWYTDVPRGVKEVGITKVESQLSELTQAVLLLAKDKQRMSEPRACGICLGKGHPTDMCPSLQEDSEEVKAMGGYSGQPYQRTNGGFNQNFNHQGHQNFQPNPTPYHHQRTTYAPPGFQQQAPPLHQASSSGTGMPLEDIVKSLATSTQAFQQETRASIKSLEQQVSQLANSVAKLDSQGKLPGNTEPNPKHTACAISLRNEESYESHEIPKGEEVVEDVGKKEKPVKMSRKALNDKRKEEEAEWRAKYHPPPFPQRLISRKETEEDKEIMDMFKKVELNIPLLNAIKQIPRYAKFLKDFCTSKRKFKSNEILQVNENVSFVLKKGVPLKCKDPGAFTIPCNLGNIDIPRVMLDNGASINVLPYSIFKNLNMGELKETGITIQLADKSLVRPKGVLEDILVQVKHLVFPADFYVLDMDDDCSPSSSSILLGRPFLKTSRTKFDCYDGSLTMEFDGDVIHFNIPDPIKSHGDVLSVNCLGTMAPIIDNDVVATNHKLQVLVVEENVAIGTPISNEVKVKKEEKVKAVELVESDETKVEGAVGEVPKEVNVGEVAVVKKKKNKRRKWKWLNAHLDVISHL